MRDRLVGILSVVNKEVSLNDHFMEIVFCIRHLRQLLSDFQLLHVNEKNDKVYDDIYRVESELLRFARFLSDELFDDWKKSDSDNFRF